ncbi:MAG: FecR family protein [Pseudomonadota bacterium]
MTRSSERISTKGRAVSGKARAKALRRALMLSTVMLLPTQAFGEIGTVAAVNRDLDGTPPSATRRALTLGNNVVQEELIQTSPIGSGQLMFLDQTTLTVAPNSDIVLDEYVYDPNQQTGEIAISLTKGALRFIGGRISKQRDAIVRTPTATVGIRGGLTVIQVADDGATNVIHLAGENTSVTDKGGKKVNLSRPNASANSSEGGGVEYQGIVDAEGLEQVYSSFEGSGDGGSDSLSPQGSRSSGGGQQQAGGNQQQSGGEQQEGNLEAFLDEQLGDVAELNSDSEGAAETQPVSTSGEAPVAESEEQVDTAGSTTEVIDTGSGSGSSDDDPEENVDTGNPVVVVDPPVEPPVEPPVVINPDTPVVDPNPLRTDTDLTGGFVSPTTGAITFDQVERGSLIGTSGSETIVIPVPESPGDFVSSAGGNTGFFSFPFPSDSGVPGGSSTTLGDLQGSGFSDLDEDFHFYAVSTDPAQNNNFVELGAVLFGNPTPGQNAFVEDPGLANPTSNVVESYILGDDLADATGTSEDEAIRIINNSGEDRFPNPSNQGTTTAGASRVLATDFRITDRGNGQTDTEFFVLADALFQDSGGDGLRFGTTVLGIDGFGDQVEIFEDSVGTFEDADGNTVFGSNGQYIGLTSAARPGPGQPFTASNTGVNRTLGDAGTPADDFAVVAIRNPLSLDVVDNPLALAASGDNAVTRATGAAQLEGFTSGIAICEIGVICGRDRDGDGTGDRTYGVRGSAEVSFNDGNANSIDDNSVNVLISVGTDNNASSTALDNGGVTLISASGPDATNAYVSDKEFGGLHRSAGQNTGSIVVGTSSQDGAFGFATFDQINFSQLGLPQDPTFLRWGTWSAVYEVDPNREDAVTAGFFVLGAPTDATLLPFQGLAEFSGDTIGTRTDLSGNRNVVTGDFTLAYDFGAAEGLIDLSIGEFAFNGVQTFEGNNLDEYQFEDVGNDLLFGEGRFFDGDGSGFAATAGSFGIVSDASQVQVEGVFGAEQPNFDPNGSLFYGAEASGSFFADDTGFVPFGDTFASAGLREGTGFGFATDAETVTITVPTDDADFITPDGSNEGLFAFGDEIGLGSPTGFPQGSSTTLGNLNGFGFSDLDENFHAYFVENSDDPTNTLGGQFVFGVPNEFQASLPTVAAISNFPAANILTPLEVGPNLVDGPNGGGGISQAFLLSNTDEGRFSHFSHAQPSNGGRIGGASFTSGIAENGAFSQELTVFAGRLFNDGNGGLRFGLPGFSTDTRAQVNPSSTTFNIGVAEDINGDTVFGETDLRFVASSVVRDDPQSDFNFVRPQTTLSNNSVVDADAILNVATIQENNSLVINEPFANALSPSSATVAASAITGQPAVPILTGFATGLVQCGSSNCGDLRPSGVGLTGSYSVSGSANFTFDGNDQTTDDSNGLVAAFLLNSDELDNAAAGPNGATSYQFTTTDDTTFAANDVTFAGTGTGANGGIVTNGNIASDANFAFASAGVIQGPANAPTGALQDAGLLRANAPEPDFMSWGIWNASFEQTEIGQASTRRDILSTGFFVAGAPVDPSQIPQTGTAQYDGIAVAQRQDLNLNSVQAVGGLSQVNYDFGTGEGFLTLVLDQVGNPGVAEISVSGIPVFDGDAPDIYSGFQSGAVEVIADGQFYATSTDPVGATGGTFQINDSTESIRYDGVYAADRTN